MKQGFWKAVVRSGWAKNPVDTGFCGVLGALSGARSCCEAAASCLGRDLMVEETQQLQQK